MAQKWPKIAEMAQKLAPAKKIAEIYLQYPPLFASLSIHTIKFQLLRHPPTKLFISLLLLTFPFDLSLSLRIYAATIRIKLTPNKMETNLNPKY